MKEALKQIVDLLQPVAALADRTPFEHSEVIQRCVDATEIALEALAQPAQEPVAWMDIDGNFSDNNDHKCFPIPLYTIIHPTPLQQEPVAKYIGECYEGSLVCLYDDVKKGTNFYTTPPAAQPEERNFCPRCGKRTADLTVIHTCTPPQENT